MDSSAVRNVARMEQLAAAVSEGARSAVTKARRLLAALARDGNPGTLALLLDCYAGTMAGTWENRQGIRQKVECLVDDIDDAADDCLALSRWQRFWMTRRWVVALLNLQAAERAARHWLDHQRAVMNQYEVCSLEMVIAKAARVAAWCREWRAGRDSPTKA